MSDRELVARLDRELAGARLSAVDAHLATCERCRARAEELHVTAMAVRIALRSEQRDDRRQAEARGDLATALDREAARLASQRWQWRRTRRVAAMTAAAAVIVGVFALARPQPSPSPGGSGTGAMRALPIAHVTPGAVSSLTAAQLCTGERPSRVVTPAVARAVLRDYGMENVPGDEYELDALITPELGGTADAANLWPQRYTGGVWTAYVKDEIENYLRDSVCSGSLDLAVAQREIATDWIAAYQRHFHRDRPSRMGRARDEAPELIVAELFLIGG